MIDTNKYEGHTRGPWSIKTNNTGHSVKDANGDHVCTIPDPIGMSNKHIIADAPLLLAEVKSWRDSYIDLWNICIELYDGDIELHRFKDWLDERSGGDLYPMKHEEESQ